MKALGFFVYFSEVFSSLLCSSVVATMVSLAGFSTGVSLFFSSCSRFASSFFLGMDFFVCCGMGGFSPMPIWCRNNATRRDGCAPRAIQCCARSPSRVTRFVFSSSSGL